MADTRNLKLAGALFMVVSLIFYITRNMTMGTVFLAIGAVCLGIAYGRKAKGTGGDS